MNITVIGTGYVGLVTGSCFAEFGNNVTCVDKDQPKIEKLLAGQMPFYEPGLETLVGKNVREGRLHFSTNLRSAVEKALVVFVAVGTPPSKDGSADMSQISAVAHEIAESLNDYKVIVTKSTVPVGAAKLIRSIIEVNKVTPCRFSVAANPEFLREGAAINDFMRPDRVVIGYSDEESAAILKDLYRPLYLTETPFVLTSPESAEMIKYASNAFLATKVSFINEIANLCDLLGANVQDVSKGMGMDERIGSKFLHPGPGFGGSCFPKDAMALVALGRTVDYRVKIVESALQVNEDQKASTISRIKRLVPDLKGKTIGILGLSFKPETDDMREAPSLYVIERLLSEVAKVKAFDPVAKASSESILYDIEYCDDEYAVADNSDAIVIVTEWNQFRSLDLNRIKASMKAANLIDLRNIYEPDAVRNIGFTYVSIGRI